MTAHHTSLYHSDANPAPQKVLKQELVTLEETPQGLRIARLSRAFSNQTHRDIFTSEHVLLAALEVQKPVEQALDIASQVDTNWQPPTDSPASRAFMEQLKSIAKGGYLGRETAFGVKREDKGVDED